MDGHPLCSVGWYEVVKKTTGTTNLGHCGSGSNGHEIVLYIPNITKLFNY